MTILTFKFLSLLLTTIFLIFHREGKVNGQSLLDERILAQTETDNEESSSNSSKDEKIINVLFTLKRPPQLDESLELVQNPQEFFKFRQSQMGIPMGNAAFSTQSFLNFISTGSYQEERGKYVVEVLERQFEQDSKAFKQALSSKAPNAKVIQQFIVSSSLLVSGLSAAEYRQIIQEMGDLIEEAYLDKPFSILPSQKILHQSSTDTEREAPPSGSIQWNLKFIKADKVWKELGISGAGSIYANADTGVDWEHSALRQNYLGMKDDGSIDHNYAWWDAVKGALLPSDKISPKNRCGFNSKIPCDDNGHGTHTMSTAVGREGLGVAPGARWMACRNMDRGFGSNSSYLGCLEFFLAPTDLEGKNPRPEARPHVIGNSYGCPAAEGCAPNAFRAASRALKAAGILMSVSAGNSGPSCSTIDTPPAFEPLVFTVGALSYKSRKLAEFSSRGPIRAISGLPKTLAKPDFVAPGEGVLGAFPGGKYASLAGTSMASPHLSGLLLLMSEGCRCLGREVETFYRQVVDSCSPIPIGSDLETCGQEKPSDVPNSAYGYGLIDALKSVKACEKKCEMMNKLFAY